MDSLREASFDHPSGSLFFFRVSSAIFSHGDFDFCIPLINQGSFAISLLKEGFKRVTRCGRIYSARENLTVF